MFTTLIEPSELAPRAADPDWTVVDCRFDLARPGWGPSAFAESHVPNALYANLDNDLSGPVTPVSGRHPLPTLESFTQILGRWGIDRNVQVVAYDQGNGVYASRLWWLLRWVGHDRVAVLNGGFAAWQQAGLPVSSTESAAQRREFVARPGLNLVSTAEVLEMVTGGNLASGREILVDARAADRFAGQNETLDPVAGHIPGAYDHPYVRNLDAQGRFLSGEVLRGQWLETLRGMEPTRAVAMCGSGVTACHNLLALEIAGLRGARLYAGSWSEWIRDAARPVARGP